MAVTLHNAGKGPRVFELSRKFEGTHSRITSATVVKVRSAKNRHGEESRVQSPFRGPPCFTIHPGETVEGLPDDILKDPQVEPVLRDRRSGLRARRNG